MTNRENNSTAFIITGMHRSGTSLTASLMQSAGVHIGERLMGAAHANPKGHFENLDFVDFHEYTLRSYGIGHEGWTIQSNIQPSQQMVDKARLIIAENAVGEYWGWKDPRTTLFLHFWQSLLPQAYFVFTYRSPWEVIDSLYRRGDVIFSGNPQYALQIWMHYNRVILDFYSHFQNRSILLNIDNIIADYTVVSRLCEQKFGVKLRESNKDVLDKSLITNLTSSSHRKTLIQKVFPEAVELYNELNKKSDLSCHSVQLSSLENDLPFKDWVLQDWFNGYKIYNDSRKELERLQTQLQQLQLTQQHSQNLETQLQQLQVTQQLTQQHSQNLETQLQLTQQHSQNLETQLQLTQQHSQNLETQMQNSKLWQLRGKLLKLKKALLGSVRMF